MLYNWNTLFLSQNRPWSKQALWGNHVTFIPSELSFIVHYFVGLLGSKFMWRMISYIIWSISYEYSCICDSVGCLEYQSMIVFCFLAFSLCQLPGFFIWKTDKIYSLLHIKWCQIFKATDILGNTRLVACFSYSLTFVCHVHRNFKLH